MPFDAINHYTDDERHCIEALHELKLVVDSVPEKQFNMNTWMEISPHCGTAGCALGWAATDQWFTDRGLWLHWFTPTFRLPGESSEIRYTGYTAAKWFFRSLTLDQVNELFNPERYIDHRNEEEDVNFIRKERVLERIDRMIETVHQRAQARALAG